MMMSFTELSKWYKYEQGVCGVEDKRLMNKLIKGLLLKRDFDNCKNTVKSEL